MLKMHGVTEDAEVVKIKAKAPYRTGDSVTRSKNPMRLYFSMR